MLGPGQGNTVMVAGDPFTFKAVSRDPDGAYSLVEVAVSVHGPPPHIHRNEDEGFYVVEGEFDTQLGERTIRADAGSFVFGSRGVVHSYSKVGAGPAKLLEIFSPAGFEHFLEEIAGLSDLDEIRTVAQKYNMKIASPSAT